MQNEPTIQGIPPMMYRLQRCLHKGYWGSFFISCTQQPAQRDAPNMYIARTPAGRHRRGQEDGFRTIVTSKPAMQGFKEEIIFLGQCPITHFFLETFCCCILVPKQTCLHKCGSKLNDDILATRLV
ncbi:hypothetical protein EJB05_01152 [Eragrostis curvula]|uniref:Uncharacterized protein n=1 Tax=Eragrostis curvula TaxID=38414 RepID=A0A5J9WR88_9POAL|nr:hypothetical protein EJB05_01152 [Eragrostis curvula]